MSFTAPKVVTKLIPKGRAYGRPGYALKGNWSITVHNTGNESPGADAETHNRYLQAGHAISWHATVDHDSVVINVPFAEQTWHAGTNAGNTTSESVEVCEYPQNDAGRALQARATENAAWWVAKRCREKGVAPSSSTVRTHKSWSGKNCPRDILPNWSGFMTRVKAHYDSMGGKPAAKPAAKPSKPAAKPSMPLLRNGSRGGAVKTLQTALNKAGAKPKLAVDGIFGEKTLSAVEAFQKRAKLAVDGEVGRKTWEAVTRPAR